MCFELGAARHSIAIACPVRALFGVVVGGSRFLTSLQTDRMRGDGNLDMFPPFTTLRINHQDELRCTIISTAQHALT